MAEVAYEIIELLESDDEPELEPAESAPNTPTAVLLLGFSGPAAAAKTSAADNLDEDLTSDSDSLDEPQQQRTRVEQQQVQQQRVQQQQQQQQQQHQEQQQQEQQQMTEAAGAAGAASHSLSLSQHTAPAAEAALSDAQGAAPSAVAAGESAAAAAGGAGVGAAAAAAVGGGVPDEWQSGSTAPGSAGLSHTAAVQSDAAQDLTALGAGQQQQHCGAKRHLLQEGDAAAAMAAEVPGSAATAAATAAAAAAGAPGPGSATGPAAAAVAAAGDGAASCSHKRQRVAAGGAREPVQQALPVNMRRLRPRRDQQQQQLLQQGPDVHLQQQQEQQQQQQQFEEEAQQDQAQQRQRKRSRVQEQQGRAQPLTSKFKVWPDLQAGGSNGLLFDLIPGDISSPGAFTYMHKLQEAATATGDGPAAAAAAGGAGKKSISKKQNWLQAGSRPIHKRNTRAAAAAAAAAAADGGSGSAANPAAAAGGGCGSIDTIEISDSSSSGAVAGADGYADNGDSAAAAAAAVAATAGAGINGNTAGDTPHQQRSPQQQPKQHNGLASAAAAAAGGGEDEKEWYKQAKQQRLHFTWHSAPCGKFYRVEVDQETGAVTLVPYCVLTRADCADQLRRMDRRTRVDVVTDPCHPTQFNPIRATYGGDSEQQHMLVANQSLKKDAKLGLYWGQLVTHKDDVKASMCDLSCEYGLKNAYSMPVEWTLALPSDVPDGPLVVVGDDSICRMCFVNDTKSWVQDMDAKGLGPCPQAAAGCCNCHTYAKRKANIKWRHCVYRSLRGDYIAVILAMTSRPVKAGQELLATYEDADSSAAFWEELRGNVQLHSYVSTLKQSRKVMSSTLQDLQRVASLGLTHAQTDPQHAVKALQHIQAVLQRAIQVDAQDTHKLDVLQQESDAWALGGPMPPDVVAARRGMMGPAAVSAAAAAAAAVPPLAIAAGAAAAPLAAAAAAVEPVPAAAAAAAAAAPEIGFVGGDAGAEVLAASSGSTLGSSSLQPTDDLQRGEEQQQPTEDLQQQQQQPGQHQQVEPGDEAMFPA